MLENNALKRAPPRISDKLQNIYSEEAYQFRNQEQLRKRLYSQIINQSSERVKEKQYIKKSLEKQENQQIGLFWRNQEERLRGMERKRQAEIDEARRVNNGQLKQLQHKSMETDAYHLQKSFREDLSNFQQHEHRKKQERQKFYKEGMQCENARQQKKRYERELQYLIFKKKENEDKQLNARRIDYYTNWKNKHFEQKHPEINKLYDQISQQRSYQQQQLQNAIAVKGGLQMNKKIAYARAQQMQEYAQKKEKHVKELKNQIQENTYKQAIDKYLEMNYEKNKLHQMNKVIAEKDQLVREEKRMIHGDHLNVLRNQMKIRNLLPEPDKIEFAGIGSPAHIGKLVHDDRLKQLKYIQRSLLQQIQQI